MRDFLVFGSNDRSINQSELIYMALCGANKSVSLG